MNRVEALGMRLDQRRRLFYPHIQRIQSEFFGVTIMEAAIARWRVLDKSSCPFSEIVGNMPASYFGIVLGLAGLGNAWRGAERTWQLPKFIEDWIYLIAGVVWAVFVVIYVLKALLMPDKLPAVAAHFQGCFIGLAGVATMLVAGGLAPDAGTSACVLFGIGFASTLCFALRPTAAYRAADIGKMFDVQQRRSCATKSAPWKARSTNPKPEETRIANHKDCRLRVDRNDVVIRRACNGR